MRPRQGKPTQSPAGSQTPAIASSTSQTLRLRQFFIRFCARRRIRHITRNQRLPVPLRGSHLLALSIKVHPRPVTTLVVSLRPDSRPIRKEVILLPNFLTQMKRHRPHHSPARVVESLRPLQQHAPFGSPSCTPPRLHLSVRILLRK